MTIRARLTIWYAGLSLGALVFLGAGLYNELVLERQADAAHGRPPDSVQTEIREILLLYALPAFLIITLGGWGLTSRALGPIRMLTETAKRITLHHLDQRLRHKPQHDELDRLIEVFNRMLERLDDSFARVRDFTLHASHELKTPLTIMQGEMETALRDEACTPAQRDLYASQLDEIQRLTQIVDGLTLLAKADAGLVAMRYEPVRFDELVKSSFADAQVLAQPKQVRVSLNACDDITVRGDRHRLRQLLLNLTDNAIKYNQPQGNVTMGLSRRNGDAELTISNTGAGIPPEQLPRVFDRFFRGDPAHSNKVEGCGLGLSIAQWIVKAHCGSIQIASQPQSLTTVTIHLPLAPAA